MSALRRILPLLVLGFWSIGWAQMSFYEGQTRRVIVGLAPGGGYDVYRARSRAIWENISPAIRASSWKT